MTDSRSTARIVRFPGQGAAEGRPRPRARRSVLDALDECLEARRTGGDLDAVLARHPEHRTELLALIAVSDRLAASARRARRTPLPPLGLPSLTQARPPTRASASPPLLRLTTLASVGALFAAHFLSPSTWLMAPALWTAMLSWLAWWLNSQTISLPDAGARASQRGDAAFV